MSQWLAIAAGGALGSVGRFWISNGVYQWLGRGFPYGTLVVNVVGSLLMGFLFVLLVERLAVSPEWRGALLVGFLGGLTTFSTFSMETLVLLESEEYLKAVLNAVVSVIVCVGAAWIGLVMARQL